MEKLKIPYPVIVEGKYDKIKLSSVLDADIFITEGFGVFRRSDKAAVFSALAKKSKIIVLTDSDGGGRVIRNFFNSSISKDRLIHLYIPQIAGKEKRKAKPSKAGTLGVEGMDTKTLYQLFLPFANGEEYENKEKITKAELYEVGLSGRAGSCELRASVSEAMGLPKDISANALLEAVNILYGKEEFLKIIRNVAEEKNNPYQKQK